MRFAIARKLMADTRKTLLTVLFGWRVWSGPGHSYVILADYLATPRLRTSILVYSVLVPVLASHRLIWLVHDCACCYYEAHTILRIQFFSTNFETAKGCTRKCCTGAFYHHHRHVYVQRFSLPMSNAMTSSIHRTSTVHNRSILSHGLLYRMARNIKFISFPILYLH
jgi:hypothetical protein